MSSTWARAMQTFTKYCMPYPGILPFIYNGFYRAGGAVEAAVAHRDSTDARNAKVYVRPVMVNGAKNWLPFSTT